MKYHRWNFEATDTGIVACKDEHDKGQPCEYEELPPIEILKIINDMRSTILKCTYLFQQIELIKLELEVK